MTTYNEGPALLDVKAVAALFQSSPSTIWRRVNDGTMPRPKRHQKRFGVVTFTSPSPGVWLVVEG